MATAKFLEFDGIGPVADFTVGAGGDLVAGFVEISSNWTLKQSTSSGVTRPVGLATGSASASSTGCEVRDKGYVWLLGQDAMDAADPVFPSAVAGRIIKTGIVVSGATVNDSSGVSLFPGGFGTVIKGAAASGNVLFKIQSLA